jgi:hypothetical protein
MNYRLRSKLSIPWDSIWNAITEISVTAWVVLIASIPLIEFTVEEFSERMADDRKLRREGAVSYLHEKPEYSNPYSGRQARVWLEGYRDQKQKVEGIQVEQ